MIISNWDHDYQRDFVTKKDFIYCVLDIKTTGISNSVNEITEICVLKYKNFRLIATLHEYVKINKKLPSHIAKLTKITDEILKKGMTCEGVLHKIKQFIGNHVLLAHYGSRFDLKFLNFNCQKYQIPEIKNPLIDTVFLARRLFIDDPSHKLVDLIIKFKIKIKVLNNAVDDAIALAEIWKYLFRELQKKDIRINDLYNLDILLMETNWYHAHKFLKLITTLV